MTRLEEDGARILSAAMAAAGGSPLVTLRLRRIEAFHVLRALSQRPGADARVVAAQREAFRRPPPWNARHDGKTTSLLTIIGARAPHDPAAAAMTEQLLKGLPRTSGWSDEIDIHVEPALFARLLPAPHMEPRLAATRARRAAEISNLVAATLEVDPAPRARERGRPSPRHPMRFARHDDPEGLYLAVAYRPIAKDRFEIQVHHDGPSSSPGDFIRGLGDDFGYSLDRTIVWRDFQRRKGERTTCILLRSWLERATRRTPSASRDCDRYRDILSSLTEMRKHYGQTIHHGSVVAFLWHRRVYSAEHNEERLPNERARVELWRARKEIEEALASREALFAREKTRKSWAQFMKDWESERLAPRSSGACKTYGPLRLEPHEWVKSGCTRRRNSRPRKRGVGLSRGGVKPGQMWTDALRILVRRGGEDVCSGGLRGGPAVCVC